MSKLRGRQPKIVEVDRTKMLVYGREKVGKTTFALGFPSVYYIDTEGGAVREQYQEKLLKSGGMYFGQAEGSLNYKIVLEEIITLATEKHVYKTLVIDSFSKLYNTARAIAEEDEKIGSAFGADKKEANKPTRQLIRWLDKIDMNVILICHSTPLWEGTKKNREITGTTFDGYDKWNYELDLLIEAIKIRDDRKYLIKASRVKEMPEGMIGALDYKDFATAYGVEKLTKEQTVYIPATPEQVGIVQAIIVKEKLSEGAQREWLGKVNAETWAEAPKESVQKWINYYNTKEK